MALEYPHVEERDGSYYVLRSRIPISTVVYHWNNGASPESIQRKFPTLSLGDIYGAVVFYLDHREMLDVHFKQIEAEEQHILDEIDARNAPFREEIETARCRLQGTR
jgi:uncharacterized protein (DUF433 family)